MSSTEYRVIAGLGNPGARYENTRHNLGFMLVEELARVNSGAWRERDKSLQCEVLIEGQSILLIKPLSFMNLSGHSISSALSFKKLGVNSLIVAHDDLDLPLGKLRIRVGGGDGGHNGLRSIRECLGSGDYTRIKLGIGRPADPRIDIANWVLGKLEPEERVICEELVVRGADSIKTLVTEGAGSAQNKHNR